MRIEPLEIDPGVRAAIDLQRGMSTAETADDMLYEFARRFRELSGATHLMSLDVQGLAPGDYRMRDAIDLTVESMTREHARSNSRWTEPDHAVDVHSGEALGRLLVGESPKVFRGFDAEVDPSLAPFLGGPKDGVAMPVFVRGEVAEWSVLFFPPGTAFDPERLRIGMFSMNMLSRSAMQLDLHMQVIKLSDRLTREMDEIGRVQRSLLPVSPGEGSPLEIEVRYQPCEVAGGDYYDFHRFDEHSLGVVIADVSGHGPVAAVAMAMLRTAVHTHGFFNNPAESVAEDVNKIMLDGLRDGTFVTAVFVNINELTGEMNYFNCGHCYPIIRRRSGEIEQLTDGHGPPLGVLQELEIRVGSTTLHPGESLVLLTDGIVETFSPDHELFGEDRLRETLASAPTEAAGMLWALLEAVDEHAAGGPRRDDQCVVVVKRNA